MDPNVRPTDDRRKTRKLFEQAETPASPPHVVRRSSPLVPLVVVLFGILLGLAVLYGLLRISQGRYDGQILPNTYVLGTDLGGLSVDEATAALAALPQPQNEGMLALTDGTTTWETPWANAGLAFDANATAEAAYRIGHTAGDRTVRRWFEVLWASHDVSPIYGLDSASARHLLELAATGLAREPGESTIRLVDGQITITPGAPGRTLDIEASTQALVAAAASADRSIPVSLVFQPVSAAVPDMTSVQSEIDAWLARPLTIETYDILTDHIYRWELGSDTLQQWLRVGTDEEGAVEITVSQESVAATLTDLQTTLGESLSWRMDDAVAATLATYQAGGGTVSLYLSHAESTYTVQAGDTGGTIAAAHGMPLWALQEANPDARWNTLQVGDRLIIPSQDVLTPLIPVPEKRIVISLADHRLRAYENGTLRWDWIVAVGRPDSPTATGVFQVLTKEDMAYASLWDLQMPDFIGIYKAGPAFYNGIHALPILSSGYRLWDDALGTDASYGCIILGVDEAAQLYACVELGVPVIIEP